MKLKTKRHFLAQAQTLDLTKHKVANTLLSEKYDGIRAYWDGGITTGLVAQEVPWANVEKSGSKRICTGLWSRYGNIISAPDWFLAQLPAFPLDGELWCGRGFHQQTQSTVSKHVPVDSEWQKVTYMVFDSPRYSNVFFNSFIDLVNYKKEFSGILEWITARIDMLGGWNLKLVKYVGGSHWDVFNILDEFNINKPNVQLIPQWILAKEEATAKEQVEYHLSRILSLGGEGIVTREKSAEYEPTRTKNIRKLKPYKDAEAIVWGFITGRETELGSKLLGLIGAMIVDWKGVVFELSGFTEEERILIYEDTLGEFTTPQKLIRAKEWAILYPGAIVPHCFEGKHFKRGDVITFKYRELTDSGVPKEANYLRKHKVI